MRVNQMAKNSKARILKLPYASNSNWISKLLSLLVIYPRKSKIKSCGRSLSLWAMLRVFELFEIKKVWKELALDMSDLLRSKKCLRQLNK